MWIHFHHNRCQFTKYLHQRQLFFANIYRGVPESSRYAPNRIRDRTPEKRRDEGFRAGGEALLSAPLKKIAFQGQHPMQGNRWAAIQLDFLFGRPVGEGHGRRRAAPGSRVFHERHNRCPSPPARWSRAGGRSSPTTRAPDAGWRRSILRCTKRHCEI